MNRPFTAEQLSAAKAALYAQGLTVQELCERQNLSYNSVMGVLHNRSRATRGEGHRAAIALGLKSQPSKKRSRTQAAT